MTGQKMEGKKNGLESNRLVRTRNGKETKEVFVLKNTKINFNTQKFSKKNDGAFIFLSGNDDGDFAFSIYKWLYRNAEKQVNGRIAEWSIVQYQTSHEPDKTYSRIATSFDSDQEYTNISISMVNELSTSRIGVISSWRHYHTHVNGNSHPSTEDIGAHRIVNNQFMNYHPIVSPKFFISPFDDPQHKLEIV